MCNIIDLTLQALSRMNILPEYYEDELVLFSYNSWQCICMKCRPYTIKATVVLYSSSEDFVWCSDKFRLAVCQAISSYNGAYEEFLHESDGLLLLETFITPPYSGNPVSLVEHQLTNFLTKSLLRAKSYIKGTPELRNALGQYAFWGSIPAQDRINQMACWTDVRQYTEGLVAVADRQGLYGFLDAEAQIVIPCKWAYAQPFSEGLAAVEDLHGRYGFINREGQVVIPCEWHCADWFSNGFAAVMSASGKWGFIDCFARLAVPCEWSEVDEFHEGYAQVWDADGYSYYINTHGVLVDF